jgi:hypothetical protein
VKGDEQILAPFDTDDTTTRGYTLHGWYRWVEKDGKQVKEEYEQLPVITKEWPQETEFYPIY